MTETTTPPPESTPPKVWHEGLEPELIGHAQNKGWKLDDPKTAFAAAAAAHREAQKFVGMAPEQLLRLPTKPDDEAGWSAIYQRLGVPKEAKEYDLAGVKFGDKDLEPGFVDAARAALAAGRVPKDRASEVVKPLIKYLADAETAERTADKVAIDKAEKDLRAAWGKDYDFNFLAADRAMTAVGKAAGLSEENVVAAVAALKDAGIGRAEIMRMFHAIHQHIGEDTFVEGRQGGHGNPSTLEQAQARKAELMADAGWTKRFMEGGAAERREMTNLNTLIAAAMERAA